MKVYQAPLLVLFLVAFLFASPSCKMAEKSLYSGDYDETISRSLTKLSRNKSKEKYVLLLEEAYSKANQRDDEHINYLRKEGNPNNYMRIYERLISMQARQDRVTPFLPLYAEGRTANFERVDYSSAMLEAKQNAAEFYFVSAEKLMASGSKRNAREAYDLFVQTQKLIPNFRDVSQKVNEARQGGTSFVLVKANSRLNVPLPPEFEREMTRLNTDRLSRTWLSYHTEERANYTYDYDVVLEMEQIDVSPEALREKHYSQEKEIKDGWFYLKNKKNEYILDSLGNKIKGDKFVTVGCNIIEFEQHKQAMVNAKVKIWDRNKKRVIEAFPITSESIFAHRYATFNGDLKALDKDTKALTCIDPRPFPTDFELIMEAGNTLKNVFKEALIDKRNVLM